MENRIQIRTNEGGEYQKNTFDLSYKDVLRSITSNFHQRKVKMKRKYVVNVTPVIVENEASFFPLCVG